MVVVTVVEGHEMESESMKESMVMVMIKWRLKVMKWSVGLN